MRSAGYCAVHLSHQFTGSGGAYGSGMPGLIDGSSMSVFRKAPIPTEIRTRCGEVDLMLLARIPSRDKLASVRDR
ncbi:hypothetical protein Rwratislav_00735 [Rhodococcus wratislaviensis IFP 2016]|nr:hypothetical protein Rwratislav_00735 [Rhodococcus wratislaviensis IFP 2016]